MNNALSYMIAFDRKGNHHSPPLIPPIELVIAFIQAEISGRARTYPLESTLTFDSSVSIAEILDKANLSKLLEEVYYIIYLIHSGMFSQEYKFNIDSDLNTKLHHPSEEYPEGLWKYVQSELSKNKDNYKGIPVQQPEQRLF